MNGPTSSSSLDMERLFQSAGDVGSDMLAVDWSQTPLGPPDQWPQSLRSIVHVILTSRFSMWMGWGPELTFFCNEKYRRDTLAAKYPWALGRPAHEVWAEIWSDIGPRIDAVLTSGVASWDESLLLILERDGYREETYHTFSYSPLSDEDGTIAGLFCVVSEDTDRVIGDRRMNVLRRLGGALTSTRTGSEVYAAVSDVLASDLSVLPFSLLYEFDDEGACLASAAGVDPGDPVAPERLGKDDPTWPFASLEHSRHCLVSDLATRFTEVPTGTWDEPAAEALVVRVDGAGGAPVGALVAGLNRFRRLDEEYLGFVDLIASQISSSLSSAHAFETERKRAEDLAALDRAKTVFFTNVSHEFRTPLTLILGPTTDALNDQRDPLSPLQRSRVETIHQSSERLLKLVNTLLDFSRLESGRTEALMEAVDLAEETRQIAEMFRSAIERAGLELTVDCPPVGMPVGVDREMWAKIVSNLLSNALKFTFEGGISVRLARDGGDVELAVSDTGIGIQPEEQAHLFERFHRVAGARSRTFEGSGIGLALVAELVQLHGGAIHTSSEPGRGSTFAVRLPIGTSGPAVVQLEEDRGRHVVSSYVAEAMRWVAPAEEPFARDPDRERSATEGGRPKVLVVDDNPDMRRYVAGLLNDDYDVVTADDGLSGLSAARAQRPDLVLSDVMMPNLDGFGLLEALRSDQATASTPVILLSARAGEEAAVEGLEAGADDYLIKPFSALELLARVRSNLELERSRRSTAQREHEIAMELQERLVPAPSPSFPLLELATYYQPGVRGTVVGGDWFEAIDLGRTRTALVIGDVMGKGIRAAATMGQLRSIVRAYAGLDLAPADLLEAADTRVRELGSLQIASCVYAVVDPRSSTLEYANAGHLPPLLVHGGTVERLDAPLGPPLGAGPSAYRSGSVPLLHDSLLVLYTDGLVETRSGGTDERIDRVGAFVRDWRGPLADLPAAVVEELCPTGSSDDVAVLVARVDAPPELASSEVLLEVGVGDVAVARRFATATASAWDDPPDLDDLVLIVSELVTNAVVHGRPPVRLRLTHLGDEVLIEVDDALPSAPRRRHPGPFEEHGRGLQILAMLARRSGVWVGPDHKTVWATLSVVHHPTTGTEDPRRGIGTGA